MKNVTDSDMSEIDFAYQLPDISSFDTGSSSYVCGIIHTHLTSHHHHQTVEYFVSARNHHLGWEQLEGRKL